MQKFGHTTFGCPICTSKGWTFTGVEAGISVRGNNLDLTGGVVPRAVVVCNGCGYVMEFAWNVVTGQVRHGT